MLRRLQLARQIVVLEGRRAEEDRIDREASQCQPAQTATLPKLHLQR